MRILIITNRFPNKKKGYAGLFVKRHISVHEELGASINTITPNTQISNSILRQLGFVFSAIRAGFSAEFDLVHAHWPFLSGWLGSIVARISGKPLLITSHGAYVDDFQQQRSIIQTFVRTALKRSTAIIAVSEQHKLNIEKIVGKQHKIFVNGMGVWLSPAVPKDEIRTKLSIEPDTTLLAFVGNLNNRVKGCDVLLNALTHLPLNDHKIKLVIGGQGPDREALESFVKAHNLSNYVQFLGSLTPEQVSQWLSAADICIVPSRRESFGIVALEAMMSEAVVIAAAVGGLLNNIEPGVNGFLFPREDDKALAEKILEVIPKLDDLRELKENGIRTAQKYDLKQQAEIVFNIYHEVEALR